MTSSTAPSRNGTPDRDDLRRSVTRDNEGYDAARRATMWNANVPARFPDAIVHARSIDDVVAAVRAAKAAGRRIGVRSGGHGWSGNHVRDGGVLLDMSGLTDVTIDKAAMTATAGPGVGGSDLLKTLMKEGLFFPVGHCRGVALGGYLLQGGFGWNSRMVGPACENVTAIDYVDADGDLRHASETENEEMLWAARGSGPGFFGIVVRFHLRLHRRPAFIGTWAVQYPAERLEDLVRWMDAIGPDVPPQVELQFIVSRNPSFPPPIRRATRRSPVRIELLAPVMAESRSAAKAATAFLATRPKGARVRTPLLPMPMGAMFSGVMQHYPSATNWETDNLWTHASPDELLPHLLHVAATMPPPPAHMLWLNWAPPPTRPDMAFTVEDLTYLAFYGGWKDPTDAAGTTAWSRETVAAMQSLSSGVQFADDPGRPARAVSEPAQVRLEALRAQHDTDGRFHRWIGST
ncbi:MAG: FAD-binding protein [Actinobacteria bacterium]|uniref:Unannotated protein n=1 Tax=freshwater metagenome TaxID=449393 RepID=A0A6J7EX02_9ZZZZ|nr:FAD-binding protein [Actinomycetota bacterium]